MGLPDNESHRRGNHGRPKSGIPKRKKTSTHTRLSCKIEYLPRPNQPDRSSASEFFTDDFLALTGMLARFPGASSWLHAAFRIQLLVDRCAQSSRHVELGEIISQRFKLLRDVIGQSLKAHPIGYSPHSLGMTVEKGLYFSRLSNLFFDQ